MWCGVQEKKGDGMIPSKVDSMEAYANELKDWEPLTTDNQVVSLSPGTCRGLVIVVLSGNSNAITVKLVREERIDGTERRKPVQLCPNKLAILN